MQEGAEGSQATEGGHARLSGRLGLGGHVSVRARGVRGTGGSWTAGGPGLAPLLDNTGHTDRTDSLSEFQCKSNRDTNTPFPASFPGWL